MSQPTIPRAQVMATCAEPFPHQAAARQQAAMLDAAGWRVRHHFPARPVDAEELLVLVATVRDPSTGEQVVEITSSASSGLGGMEVFY